MASTNLRQQFHYDRQYLAELGVVVVSAGNSPALSCRSNASPRSFIIQVQAAFLRAFLNAGKEHSLFILFETGTVAVGALCHQESSTRRYFKALVRVFVLVAVG